MCLLLNKNTNWSGKKIPQNFESLHKYCGTLPLTSCMMEINFPAARFSYTLLLYSTFTKLSTPQVAQPTKLLWPVTPGELEPDGEFKGSLAWEKAKRGSIKHLFYVWLKKKEIRAFGFLVYKVNPISLQLTLQLIPEDIINTAKIIKAVSLYCVHILFT